MIHRNIGYIAKESYQPVDYSNEMLIQQEGGGNGGYMAPTEPVFESDSYVMPIDQPMHQEPVQWFEELAAPIDQPQILPMSVAVSEEIPTTINDSSSEYYVQGFIVDEKTGNSIQGTILQLVILADDSPLSEPYQLRSIDGSYSAWTVNDPNVVGVKFTAPGYTTRTIPFSELLVSPDVLLKKSFPWFILLIVAGAVIAYRKKTGKVGKLSTSDVFPIMLLVGGFIAFTVIKDVLEFLGLWETKDTKDLDEAATSSGSFWNPNFWRTKPDNINYSYAITDATARQWSREIYDSFGAFNDCEECAIAVAKRCRTQANFSFLVYIFQDEYGQDLLTFLRGGLWPQDRLSDADVNTINQYIASLPKY